MWTSLIAYADYVLAGRAHQPRGQEAPRHLDADHADDRAEGFSWTPVHTMSGVDTSATYYQDVRVPVTNLVGEENARLEARDQPAQPRARRAGLVRSRSTSRWTGSASGPRTPRTYTASGSIDSEWVQLNLARVHAKAEVLKLINWELAVGTEAAPSPRGCVGGQGVRHRAGHRGLPPADGGAGHRRRRCARTPGRAAAWPHRAVPPRRALILTFGGGTNEIQRDIIGMVALGLPRVNR